MNSGITGLRKILEEFMTFFRKKKIENLKDIEKKDKAGSSVDTTNELFI